MPASVLVTGTGVLCATAGNTRAFADALRAGRSGIGLRHLDVDSPEANDAKGGDSSANNAALRPRLAADLAGFSIGESVAARAGLPEALRRHAVRLTARAPLPIRAAAAVALEAWEQADLHRRPVPPDRIGIVVAGHNLGGRYAEQLHERYAESPVHLPARFPLQFMDTDHVGTLSQLLGITGEGYTVGGASASGNVAIVNASRLVTSRVVDACLVVGALTDLSAMERQGFFNLGAMAGVRGESRPQERCRPFDADREGFVPGQGAACLVLESDASARRRRAPVRARVAGHALRLDGNGLADPSVDGEERVMREAIRHAGLTPDAIGYVNAHGTGSTLGDRVELTALGRVFEQADARPWVNSTKGLIGHCLCAAGVVEAVACLVQLDGGFVHPNANLVNPIDLECRLVGARAEAVSVDYALSNGFGFGGFNTSVVFGRVATPHSLSPS